MFGGVGSKAQPGHAVRTPLSLLSYKIGFESHDSADQHAAASLLPKTAVAMQHVEKDDALHDSAPASAENTTDLAQDLLETSVCIICQELLAAPVTLIPCGHSFCRLCFCDYMRRVTKKDCLLCSQNITAILEKNIILSKILETIASTFSQDEKTEHTERISKGKSMPLPDIPVQSPSVLPRQRSRQHLATSTSTDRVFTASVLLFLTLVCDRSTG